LAKGSRPSKLKRPVKKRKAPTKVPAYSPEAAVAAAFAQCKAAISFLKTQAATAPGPLSQQAKEDLDQLIEEAGGTPPSPSPKA
jgi:hypothetical protein